ncbi:ABC transporter ATP-binding protein [Paenibacillus sp. BIHB 4019]|uniref:ATP-binding cassette domain-containing protein n=1 Tax=Paenibacillus sp. BIHB 4019 TaxID=1870819 RepID=UPI001F322B97|nr:ABC transporter ATP-binding protein [Paenibacillus sp. BIHB 4019]
MEKVHMEKAEQENAASVLASVEAPVLEVSQLQIFTRQGKEQRSLVHNVSFVIPKGETFALVGESGSGKSVTASAVLGLMSGSLAISSGEIRFCGDNVLDWSDKKRRGLRGREIGFIFQNYQESFTPFITVGKQMNETLRSHEKLTRRQAKEQALEWLEQVGLPAERVYSSYPFQLSGGQLQRAAIAAAMMLQPALLIADEPTTALDVISGERVLGVLANLQKRTGCSVLLISHDLRHVVKRASTIAVMKGGHIVELDTAEHILYDCHHEYTQQLLNARPYIT